MCGTKASGRSVRTIIGAFLAWTLVTGSTSNPASATSQAATKKKADPHLEDLRHLGTKIGDAVLARDISTLLSFGRTDMRSQDEAALKDPKSDLYCYLFDSSCIRGEKPRSVYEKLSQARHLRIKAIDGGKSPYDGVRYAFLFFYDGSTVSDNMLRSSQFLCEQGSDRLSVWKYKLIDGRWEPVTPFFDFGTDSLCPSE